MLACYADALPTAPVLCTDLAKLCCVGRLAAQSACTTTYASANSFARVLASMGLRGSPCSRLWKAERGCHLPHVSASMHPVRFSGVTLHPLDCVDRREQRQQRARSVQQFCKERASNGKGCQVSQVFLAWLAMYTLQFALHTNRTTSHSAETCRRPTAGTPEAQRAAGGDGPSGKMWESYVVVSHEFRQKTELG